MQFLSLLALLSALSPHKAVFTAEKAPYGAYTGLGTGCDLTGQDRQQMWAYPNQGRSIASREGWASTSQVGVSGAQQAFSLQLPPTPS